MLLIWDNAISKLVCFDCGKDPRSIDGGEKNPNRQGPIPGLPSEGDQKKYHKSAHLSNVMFFFRK